MSTKAGIYCMAEDPDGVYLYEEALVGGISPAYIQVGRGRFKISHEFADANPRVTIEIDATEMDRLAIAWCKHRRLEGALGGPLGNEFGSPECEYTPDD